MTIGEIARLAGVSTSTVSKIINNKDQSINPETRERVLRIVKEYNYTPYGMAKSSSQAKTFIIAVLLRFTTKANRMISGIVQAAEEHGYSVLVFESQGDLQKELKHITSICQKKADGVLWEPVSEQSADYAHYLTELGICFIYYNQATLSPACRIDFSYMGYILTQKLISKRHSRIAILMKENNFRSEQVLEGYRKCLYENQILYDNQLELYSSDTECCSKIIAFGATGIVSSHYAAALFLYEQLERLHYNIPADFSLASLKNDINSIGSYPHISGLEIPYLAFGRFICETLIQKCEKKELLSGKLLFTPPCVFDRQDSIDLPLPLHIKRIIVIGSVNIDYTFNVDEIPQAGKTTRILNSTVTLGGKGANQAIGASRLGCDVSLITNMGDDIDSNFAMTALNNERLSTQGIFRDREMTTGKAYIYVEKDGESAITILPGANSHLSRERIRQCQHLFKNADYCLLSTEIPLESAIEAAQIGRAYGVKNIINPASLNHLPEELIPYTDILIPNRKTAAALCPKLLTVEEQADYFFEQGIPIVIITLGHNGCYLKTATNACYFSAADVTAVDTTGGGDAFISALAVYLAKGYSLEASIQIATCAASFCVTRHGVVPALVDKRTLECSIERLYPSLLDK